MDLSESKYGKFIRSFKTIANPRYDIDNPQYVVFTLTMNRLDYTLRQVESLNNTCTIPFVHVIIDQGSSDDTLKVIGDELNMGKYCVERCVVELSENIGISAGSNLALDIIDILYEEVPYIVKIDNDCEIKSYGWDQTFLTLEQVFEGKIVLSPFVEGLRENAGGAARYQIAMINEIDIGFAYHLGGVFEFSSREAYDGFRFDESDTLSGKQDSSFSSHLNSKNYRLAYVENLKCEHMDTTDGQHAKYPEYFDKRRKVESKISFDDIKEK